MWLSCAFSWDCHAILARLSAIRGAAASRLWHSVCTARLMFPRVSVFTLMAWTAASWPLTVSAGEHSSAGHAPPVADSSDGRPRAAAEKDHVLTESSSPLHGAGPVEDDRTPTPEELEAQRTKAARALANAAEKAYENEDYATAVRSARAAFHLVPAPTLVLLEARALERLGQSNEAMARYRLALGLDELPPNPVFEKAKATARKLLAELEASIPRIRISRHSRSDPRGSIELDGAPLPEESLDIWLPIDPGKHVVTYQDPTGRKERLTLDLQPGDQEALVLGDLLADDSSRPSARVITGWAAMGVGVVSIATAAAFALRAQNLEDDLDEHCPRDACPPDWHDTLSSYRTSRRLSTVAYVAGGAGIAAGSALLWVVPLFRDEQDGWSLQITPGSTFLRKAF